jgi:hypothetical protein
MHAMQTIEGRSSLLLIPHSALSTGNAEVILSHAAVNNSLA